MPVAVAHQATASARRALEVAAQEASIRQTTLEVIHVVESLDLDIAEAHRTGIADEVEKVLAAADLSDLRWELHLSTEDEDVADAILDAAADIGADVLVIGARRRSPIGKFLLGSVTQTIILKAEMPVTVVKAPIED